MWRFSKHWILSSFFILAAGSFLLTIWGVQHQPSANFYLLPTRGWELAIGAGIAFYFLFRKQTMRTLLAHRWVDELLGFTGLLMIAYATFAFDDKVPFPSHYTLVPTVGTGLIILFASGQTIVGRLLGCKPLVAIGLISYSAYLWHQPLLVFARHRSLTEPSELLMAFLAFLSLPLAYISWRYVEKPFRSKDTISRKAIFSFAIIGSVLFIGLGLLGVVSNGFENRSTDHREMSALADQKLQANRGLSDVCEDELTFSADCRTSDNPEILVWGDSIAMHLVQGILAANPDAHIMQVTKSVCGPIFDLAPVLEPEYPGAWAKNCLSFSEDVRQWLGQNSSVKYAVLSSLFSHYLDENNQLLSRSGELSSANTQQVFNALLNTLDELKRLGITPVIFSPLPTNGFDLGRCLLKSEQYGVGLDACNFAVSEIAPSVLEVYALLQLIKERYSVIFLDDLLCDDAQCVTHLDETYLFRDSVHLSIEGSMALGEKFNFYKLITNDPVQEF